jgi:hypothetical protein
MILLDWTRMGKMVCLAGLARQGEEWRVVRPLPCYARSAGVTHPGWPREFLRGRCRWEVFELVEPAAPKPQPPHLEDVWVNTLRPRYRIAPAAVRRRLLRETLIPAGKPLFGAPLMQTRAGIFLAPGTGCRSLATAAVPATCVEFTAVRRDGIDEPDVRVALHVADFEGRTLPVKDHFLLARAEAAAPDLEGQVRALNEAVRQMGPEMAVRLGVSRAYSGSPGRAPNACWVMADGFFSLTDPQP